MKVRWRSETRLMTMVPDAEAQGPTTLKTCGQRGQTMILALRPHDQGFASSSQYIFLSQRQVARGPHAFGEDADFE